MSWHLGCALLFFGLFANAEESAPPSYSPVNESLWTQALDLKKEKNWADYLNLCAKSAAKKDFKTIEGAEIHWLCVDAFVHLGYLGAASQYTLDLLRRHPGSQPALFALMDMENVLHDSLTDEDEWEANLQIRLPDDAPVGVRSMVNYFRVLHLTRLNLMEWAKQARAGIDPKSYWMDRLKFYDGIDLFKNNHTDQAIETFEDILRHPNLPDRFARTIRLQLARLYFEKKDLEKADSLYQSYTSDSRDYGRAVLERAWIEYHRKEYGKALGLLTVLKSSFFAGIKDPEQYMLAALIYRELCHFDAIKSMVKEFDVQNKTVLRTVENHLPLNSDDTLVGLTLAYGRLQSAADFVFQLRKEAHEWESVSDLKGIGPSINRLYKDKIAAVKNRLEFDNREMIKGFAEKILVVRNQLQILDYVSDLEKLRPKNAFTHQTYQVQQEGNEDFSKLYWPHDKEFWWGEMNDYRVLINDKCAGRLPAGSEK